MRESMGILRRRTTAQDDGKKDLVQKNIVIKSSYQIFDSEKHFLLITTSSSNLLSLHAFSRFGMPEL